MKNNNDVVVVQRACRVLESDLEAMPTLQQLASELGVPAARLHRAFKRIAGRVAAAIRPRAAPRQTQSALT